MYSVKKIEESNLNEYLLSDNKANASAKVSVARGGILTSFKVNGKERIYLDADFYDESEEKFRGGNPILFPSCGRLTDKAYTLNGKKYEMPIHGFARDYAWQIAQINETDAAELTLSLKNNAETFSMYPFEFEVRFTYRLKDGVLSIIQQVINNSDAEMPFSLGLHPYFCADTSKAKVEVPSKLAYFVNDRVEFDGVLNATDDLDHVCVNLTGKKATLDTGLGYSVDVSYEGKYTCVVVWSPMNNTQFVCVEPWSAAPDALNTKENLIYLAPGKSETFVMDFAVSE